MSKIFICTVIICLFLAPMVTAQEFRANGPKGKNWEKISDYHYINKSSIQKVKDKIYQAELCSTDGRGEKWFYFKTRVDCESKQAWSYSNKWIGPLPPTDYEEAAMSVICK
jgi:hypothetical protein